MTGVKLKEQYISYLPLLQTLNNISVIMLLRTFNIISLILEMRKGDYVIQIKHRFNPLSQDTVPMDSRVVIDISKEQSTDMRQSVETPLTGPPDTNDAGPLDLSIKSPNPTPASSVETPQTETHSSLQMPQQ